MNNAINEDPKLAREFREEKSKFEKKLKKKAASIPNLFAYLINPSLSLYKFDGKFLAICIRAAICEALNPLCLFLSLTFL